MCKNTPVDVGNGGYDRHGRRKQHSSSAALQNKARSCGYFSAPLGEHQLLADSPRLILCSADEETRMVEDDVQPRF